MGPKCQDNGEPSTAPCQLHRGFDHCAMPQVYTVKHSDGQMHRPRRQRGLFQSIDLYRQIHRTKLGTASRAGISRFSISVSESA